MDPYSILRIPRDSSEKEIRKAYRKMAAKYHPDKGGEAWIFQQVQEAYKMLAEESARPEVAPTPPTPAKKTRRRRRRPTHANTTEDIGQSGSQTFSGDLNDAFANPSPYPATPIKRRKFKQTKLRQSGGISPENQKLIIILGSVATFAIVVVSGIAIALSGGGDDPVGNGDGINLALPENITSDPDVDTELAVDATGQKRKNTTAVDPVLAGLGGSDSINSGKPVVKFGIEDGRVFRKNWSDMVEFKILVERVDNARFVLSKSPVSDGPRFDRGEFKWVPGPNVPPGSHKFTILVESTLNGTELGKLDFEVDVLAEGRPERGGAPIAQVAPRGAAVLPIGSDPNNKTLENEAGPAGQNSNGDMVAPNIPAVSMDVVEADSADPVPVERESSFSEATPRNLAGVSSIAFEPTTRNPRLPRQTEHGHNVEFGISGCAPHVSNVDEEENTIGAYGRVYAASDRESDLFCLRVFDDQGVIRTSNELPLDGSNCAGLGNVLNYKELEDASIRLAIEFMGEINETLIVGCLDYSNEAGFLGPDCRLQLRIPLSNDGISDVVLPVLESLPDSVFDSIQLVAIFDPKSDSLSTSEFKSALTEAKDSGFEGLSIKLGLTESGYDYGDLYSNLSLAKQMGLRVGIEEVASADVDRQRDSFLKSIREEVDTIFVVVLPQDDRQDDRRSITEARSLVYLNVASELEGQTTWRRHGKTETSFSTAGPTDPKLVVSTEESSFGASLAFNSSAKTKLELFDGDNEYGGGVLISTSVQLPSQTKDGTTQCIVSKSSKGANSGFSLELHNPVGAGMSDCVLRFGVGLGRVYQYAEIPFSRLDHENICHVVASYAGNGDITLCVNGAVKSAPIQARGEISQNDLPIVLGARPALDDGESTDFFDGSIQMLSILKNTL